ncbi:hypothetical protein P280DRAFT_474925 [Massarina eburnea CBS 473.64]|uniref:Uncharacterized protein n=1 Tax=Massarina eburnea CBS 473.64 TaxID=1395130 RepID=A0A6A6RFS5_9PLEO|nr:hypothetical protein P280DRAFT_474925 [Massarina eburnea CBS 473.64]
MVVVVVASQGVCVCVCVCVLECHWKTRSQLGFLRVTAFRRWMDWIGLEGEGLGIMGMGMGLKGAKYRLVGLLCFSIYAIAAIGGLFTQAV